MDFWRLNYNFTQDFFTRGLLYPFYQNIVSDQDALNLRGKTNEPIVPKGVTVVNFIPPFIPLKTRSVPIDLAFYSTEHRNGYLANLESFSTIEEYMNHQLGPKSRSKMRSYKRRLEKCFNISYRMYLQNISKDECTTLMTRMKEMIIRRFDERGDTHESLSSWKHLEKTVYPMVLNGEAAFFVIYDEDTPIDICLSFLYKDIMNNSIRSYDIAYSKFRLGYIDIMKQIEWCLQNGFRLFDLSYGDLDYKKYWCNEVYKFNHHILYDIKSKKQKVKAKLILRILQLKWYLKDKNVHKIYRKFKNKLRPIKYKVTDPTNIPFKKEMISVDEIQKEGLIEVQINHPEWNFLKREVCDFLYSTFDHSSKIRVFKIQGEELNFLITGQEKAMRLTKEKSLLQQS